MVLWGYQREVDQNHEGQMVGPKLARPGLVAHSRVCLSAVAAAVRQPGPYGWDVLVVRFQSQALSAGNLKVSDGQTGWLSLVDQIKAVGLGRGRLQEILEDE